MIGATFSGSGLSNTEEIWYSSSFSVTTAMELLDYKFKEPYFSLYIRLCLSGDRLCCVRFEPLMGRLRLVKLPVGDMSGYWVRLRSGLGFLDSRREIICLLKS